MQNITMRRTTTYIKAIPTMQQITDNRKKSQKERICYLFG